MRQDWTVTLKKPRRAGGDWFVRARPSRRLVALGFKELLRSAETSDEVEAEKLAADLAKDLNAPSALSGKKDPTFGAIYVAYLAASKVDNEISPNTERDRRNAKPRLSELTLWSLPASKIDKMALVNSRDELKAKVKRASTVQHYFDLAKLAWKWAEDRGRLTIPWPGLERLKKTQTDKRPLSDEECERVLQAIKARASGRWFPFFCLQADVGCRIDSVLGVRGSHVDRSANKVFMTTKSGDAWFAVPPETIALLPKVTPDAFVWSTAEGKKLRRETPYSIFKKALTDAGVPDSERVDTHSLRRRWITSAGDSGIPLPVSMQQAAHKDVKNHLRYRSNAPTPDTHAAVELIRSKRIGSLRNNETFPLRIPTGTPKWERRDVSSAVSVTTNAGSYDLTSERMRGLEVADTSGSSAEHPSQACPQGDLGVVLRLDSFLAGAPDELLATLADLACRLPAPTLELLRDPERLGALHRAIREALDEQLGGEPATAVGG